MKNNDNDEILETLGAVGVAVILVALAIIAGIGWIIL